MMPNLNLGEKSIASIKKEWARERASFEKASPEEVNESYMVYTMVQSNTSSIPRITEESMKLCTEALLR